MWYISALASYQCRLGPSTDVDVICRLSLLCILFLVHRGFFRLISHLVKSRHFQLNGRFDLERTNTFKLVLQSFFLNLQITLHTMRGNSLECSK